MSAGLPTGHAALDTTFRALNILGGVGLVCLASVVAELAGVIHAPWPLLLIAPVVVGALIVVLAVAALIVAIRREGDRA